MPRWVTIRPDAFPIDYRMKSGAYLYFKLDAKDPEDKGERFLPDDQADFMIARGYAKEGKAKGSTAKSRKGKTARPKTAKRAANAPTAASDNGSNARVASGDLAAADSAGSGSGVDQASG